MEKLTLKKIFSIPNCLCYFRIALIPVFVYYYVYGQSKYDYYISALVVIISSLTDFFDGYIARRFNMITDLGKIIDPIADKLTQFTIAIMLMFTYPKMILNVAIIFIKDGMLALGSFYLFEKGAKVTGASWWGKIATAFFDGVVILLIAFRNPQSQFLNICIIISAILMFIAFIFYSHQIYTMIKNKVWKEN